MDSNLYRHAKRELELLGGLDNPMNGKMRDDLLEIVAVFAKQGHSGFSAGYVISALEHLLSFLPLSPLTGADDEWNDIGGDDLQNIRCSRVFKSKSTGKAFDVRGIVWKDPDGSRFTNRDSHVDVTFPYTPVTEYRKRGET